MQDNRIDTVRNQISSKVRLDGLDPQTAATAVEQELSALGVLDAKEIVPRALAQYQADLHKVTYLQVSTIPRRRQHEEWYDRPSQNGIWAGLQNYLLNVKGWEADPTVNSIDETSTKIVSLLDNPGTARFATRSLVVGYVQSGKTANMTAVTAKAVDADYKFVIILAGMTDALRSQTQARIETDLVDQDPTVGISGRRSTWIFRNRPITDFQRRIPRAGILLSSRRTSGFYRDCSTN